MYFHPLVPYPVPPEQPIAACRELGQLGVDGLHRQSCVQMDAVPAYSSNQRKSLQLLADAASEARLIQWGTVAATQLPVHAWETARRHAELAADLLHDHASRRRTVASCW